MSGSDHLALDPNTDPEKPIDAQAVDGRVVISDPPPLAVELTADAAEISGLRLLDAADKARRSLGLHPNG
jgi:hypothetical protein